MFAKKKTQPTTTTTKNETPDYIVRLREAIREAYEFAEEFLRDYGTDWKLHNKLCDMLKSALAAPLRNCDIYDAESCRMAYHLHGDGPMTMQAFADWLFAPAEEGATNEQK